SVATEPLASTLPRIFAATSEAAAHNDQRLAAPASQQVEGTATAPVRGRLDVSTVAAPVRLAVGEAAHDRVTVSGATPTWRGKVTVRIYGPFRSPGEIRCNRAPAWK